MVNKRYYEKLGGFSYLLGELRKKLGGAQTDALVSDAVTLCNELCGKYTGLPEKEKVHTERMIFPRAAIYLQMIRYIPHEEVIGMAQAESITFEEFRTRFSTEESCRAELFRLRFPNGFVCPKCGCTEYYPVRGRNTFQCHACRRQTSVTAGTVMHRTHLPLTAWFWAIYLCATDKRGISAVQLSRTLGICYESAWYLLHRIRRAMAQRDENYALSGIVEVDDGYVGGATRNGKRGRGTDKAKIVVALSKSENEAALFTRMQVVEDVTSKTLQQVIGKTVATGAKIECDGYRSYKNLSGVELDAKKYEPGDLHWLHKAISNLKAFLLGTYHGRCTQLQSYLDEFCFRFNRKKTGDQIFLRLARAVAASCAQLH